VESIDRPQTIARYQVVRELGRGGMGIVYLDKDSFIDRLVAIKNALNTPFDHLRSLDEEINLDEKFNALKREFSKTLIGRLIRTSELLSRFPF
jgi:serine/threonine protein kinase